MEEERKYCVYMHTAPNGKKYIGITGREPNKRWKNGMGYIRQPHFYNAIQKYGWNNFKHKILFNKLTKKEAERLEQICVALFRTNIGDYGYNKSIGGESGSLGCKKTPEQIEYLRQINLGKKLSPQHKKKLSEAHKGKQVFTEEQKAQLRERWIYNNPNSRSVYCLETDKSYISGAMAAREIGLTCSDKNVTRCCRGETKSVQGYHFCFTEDKDTFDWEEVKTNKKKRRIYCDETGEIYESAAEAARVVLNSQNNGGIIRNCQGKQSICQGYHFHYAD